MSTEDLERIITHSTYTVSYQDLVDIWVESLHPEDSVVVIWDARTHYDKLKKIGFLLAEDRLYDNKILTVQVESVLDAFAIADLISSLDHPPYVQIYSSGKLLGDNIEF